MSSSWSSLLCALPSSSPQSASLRQNPPGQKQQKRRPEKRLHQPQHFGRCKRQRAGHHGQVKQPAPQASAPSVRKSRSAQCQARPACACAAGRAPPRSACGTAGCRIPRPTPARRLRPGAPRNHAAAKKRRKSSQSCCGVIYGSFVYRGKTAHGGVLLRGFDRAGGPPLPKDFHRGKTSRQQGLGFHAERSGGYHNGKMYRRVMPCSAFSLASSSRCRRSSSSPAEK